MLLKNAALESGWGWPVKEFFIGIEGFGPLLRCGARIIVVLVLLLFAFHRGFGLMR